MVVLRTRMSSVSHSYVLVCHLYVTRMYLCVIRMSLVCTYLLSVCHLYVVLPWILWKTLIQFKQKLWRLQVLLEILVISYAFHFLKESKSKKGRLKRFMVKPHTSDIRMTYEYIRVIYGWYTSTYEWHQNVMTYEWHSSEILMTCDSKEK